MLADARRPVKQQALRQGACHDPREQAFAYFLDDNAFNPEQTPPESNDWWFWVKGHSKAEVVLRGPVASLGGDKWVSKAITRLTVDVRNGATVLWGAPGDIPASRAYARR